VLIERRMRSRILWTDWKEVRKEAPLLSSSTQIPGKGLQLTDSSQWPEKRQKWVLDWHNASWEDMEAGHKKQSPSPQLQSWGMTLQFVGNAP